MTVETKEVMFRAGVRLVRRFCTENNLSVPEIVEHPSGSWPFNACAYYRQDAIHICIPRCAGIGVTGRAWSYPGNTVDRTPYGVLAHELGHHIDFYRGTDREAFWSEYGAGVMVATGEAPLTSYAATHPAEWFAEAARLFITNPDLLRRLRPRTYARLIADGLKPAFTDDWRARLEGAPPRTIEAVARKVAKAA